jgi:hypothetical protein
MNLPEITREHIVSCAEYAEEWLAQAQMWRDCRRSDLAFLTLKHARQASESAFRWATANRETA